MAKIAPLPLFIAFRADASTSRRIVHFRPATLEFFEAWRLSAPEKYGRRWIVLRAEDRRRAEETWNEWRNASAGTELPHVLTIEQAARALAGKPKPKKNPAPPTTKPAKKPAKKKPAKKPEKKAPPARASTTPGRPHWMPFRTAGELSPDVRELVRGRACVYAIRELGTLRPFYVGESHTEQGKPGAVKRDLRAWMTITRHVHEWRPGKKSRSFLAHFEKETGGEKRTDEWVYRGTRDLEIAIWIPKTPAKAIDLETKVIQAFDRNPDTKVQHNKQIALPAVPF